MSDSEYLFENTASQAGDRFSALASLFDPVTIRHLEDRGVTEGWRCLELGAGGGSVAGWLSRRVGDSGRVLATDLDLRWLEQQPRPPNLELRRHDIVADPMPDETFDLIHERLVLIHVPERVAALGRLVAALQPGGCLLAEDFSSRDAPDSFVDPASADEHQGNRIMREVRALLSQRGADPGLGHQLPRMLRAAGLEDVGADAYQVIEGGDATRRLHRANITQVADHLVEQRGIARADVDRYLACLDAGTVSPSSPLMVSAWGRRPLA